MKTSDSPHQEEEGLRLHCVQSGFKILLGFEHHNGWEVILSCEDFGIEEGKK